MESKGIGEYPQTAEPVKRRRLGLKIGAGVIGAAVLVTAGIVGGSAYANYSAEQSRLEAQMSVPAAPAGQATTAQEQATLVQSDTAGAKAVADEQAKEAAAVALAAKKAAEAKAAEEAEVTKCPAGTYAEAVDGAGNESNCAPENGNGEVCQAYNDANQCTAWGKP